jgi:hypothetical protein
MDSTVVAADFSLNTSGAAIYKLLSMVFFHSSSNLRLQNTSMTPRMFLSFLYTLWEHKL